MVAYPGYGVESERAWNLYVSGIAFQDAGEFSVREKMVLRMLRNAMNASAEEVETETFQNRVAPFFADAERRCRVMVEIGDRIYPLRKRTRRNGRFRSWIQVGRSTVDEIAETDEFWQSVH